MAMGTSMLRQSGATYLESGKKYMQSWTGVLSGGLLHYHFDITSEYGEPIAVLPAKYKIRYLEDCIFQPFMTLDWQVNNDDFIITGAG